SPASPQAQTTFPYAGNSVSALATSSASAGDPNAPAKTLTLGPLSTAANGNIGSGVFIVDKITASSTEIANRRDIQPGERYFVIGGVPITPTSAGLPGAPPGTVTRFAISDGVNPLGGFDSTGTKTIAQQFLSPQN